MPDLGKCQFVDGNLYCWDKDKKDFVMVELKPIASPAVYRNVVAAFMEEKEGGENE